MSWQEPIYDRTSQDVENVRSLIRNIQSTGWENLSATEQESFLGELRGTIGKATLERVVGNMYFLEQKLLDNGYFPRLPFAISTTWNYSDVPTLELLNKLVQDIQVLVDSYHPVTRILPADLDVIVLDEWNDIEKVQWDINWGLDKIHEHNLYCGQPFCGQTVMGGLLYAQ